MKPLAIAHRGLHKDFFENTVGAFKEAGKGEYYGIETDIHLSKDKKWVIHHDDWFLTNGKKYLIKDLNAEELIKMPLDNQFNIKDAFIPYFDEYLDICKENGKRPIIEIKPKNPSFHNLKKMLNQITKRFNYDQFTIIAFYPWPLLKLRLMKGRKIHLQHLIGGEHHELINLAKRHKMDLDIWEDVLTPEILKSFHDKNLKVNVWTVDKIENIGKFEKMGVDYITTNEFNQND